jgi:multiple sugar transport system ATP-binding protein
MGGLKIESLSKIFDGPNNQIVAVDEVNLKVTDGEFLVLVGPSGSGKSTLLRMIAGLEEVTHGKIFLQDTRIDRMPPSNRDLAMVFQNYALYPHMSVKQNMAFGLEMRSNLSKQVIGKQVETIANMLEIVDLLDKRPSELSGGQQQRVALGRAIVRDPQLFLMDEPLSNLDAKLRSTMRAELQNLHKRLDTTIIYVTHDQTEAMTMGDRIAILNEGKLQQIAKPMDCYNKPANLFVAGFIGDPPINLVNLKKYKSNSNSGFCNDELNIELEPDFENIDNLPNEVICGIRPEDLEIVKTTCPNSFSAKIEVLEPLGDSQIVHLSVMNKIWRLRINKSEQIGIDDEVEIKIPDNAYHLFDPNTTLRIC